MDKCLLLSQPAACFYSPTGVHFVRNPETGNWKPMKNVILGLFVLFFLALHYHYYVPVALVLALGAAFTSAASVAAARALTARTR